MPSRYKIALWQYRWTNPGAMPDQSPEATAWKEVDRPHWQPLENRLQELRDFSFGGKPCYEVRPLFAKVTS